MGTGSLVALLLAAATVSGGRIVSEWDPGITAAEVGGPIVVDDYGVTGLGAYRVELADGTEAFAVCIQADVGHSMTTRYEPDPATPVPDELGYLLWAYLASGRPDDTTAAAINVLAWRYAGAQRTGGGPVWRDGPVDVRALGVGHLTEVEQAVDVLHAEAVARRGPWTLTAEGPGRVRVRGPGGPIAGAAVHLEADGWAADVATDAEGGAAFDPPAAGEVRAEVAAPGPGIALVAPGSQRLAIAGPGELLVVAIVPPSTTTTVPPTTTTTTPSTTTVPPTTTAPPTSTSTTSTSVSTTTTSAPSTSAPPTLPPTGTGSRGIARLGAWLFAVGAVAAGLARRRAQ